jgi:hypothetical protein
VWDGSARRRGEQTSTVFLKPQAEYSSPLVQYVNPIANRNSRGFRLADGGCNPPIGQVVTGVVIESDGQYSGIMANGSHDQVMQVFEVLGIPSQYGRAWAMAKLSTLASVTDSNPTSLARTGSCP